MNNHCLSSHTANLHTLYQSIYKKNTKRVAQTNERKVSPFTAKTFGIA